MLKLLQIVTVIIFAVMVLFGGALVIFATDKVPAFIQFAGYIMPVWLLSITSALLGKPITEAAEGLKAKLSATTTTTTADTVTTITTPAIGKQKQDPDGGTITYEGPSPGYPAGGDQ